MRAGRRATMIEPTPPGVHSPSRVGNSPGHHGRSPAVNALQTRNPRVRIDQDMLRRASAMSSEETACSNRHLHAWGTPEPTCEQSPAATLGPPSPEDGSVDGQGDDGLVCCSGLDRLRPIEVVTDSVAFIVADLRSGGGALLGAIRMSPSSPDGLLGQPHPVEVDVVRLGRHGEHVGACLQLVALE